MLMKWNGESNQIIPLTKVFPLCKAIFRYNNICESNQIFVSAELLPAI